MATSTPEKPSLAAVLQHYNVRFSPSRRRQKICCPIHGERNPSCSLTLDPGGDGEFFTCFSCGAKGDVYEFVKGIEGVDFKAAVQILEGIPGTESQRVRESDDQGRRSVPAGSGYKPRYRRAVPARTRRSPSLD